MKPLHRLAEWLGVRDAEVSIVLLSFAGAFLVMSFLVLSRALREAAYLDIFDATTLPYVMGGVVILSLPTAAAFSLSLERITPRRAMRALSLLLAVAVAATWPFLPASAAAVVVFYLVTAVGTVVLTSAFWLVVSDMLMVREAKRLFGLISAGGTLGVLVTGLAVGAAVERVEPSLLVPALVLLLLATAALNEFVPRNRMSVRPAGPTGRWTESARLIVRSDHVRTLTLVVLLVAALGTIVDYQFKEAAQAALGDERALAAFFGAFYAWTGGLALVVQLFLTTRILTRAGVAVSIAALPALLLLLSIGMFVVPGLAIATGLRGVDATMKKSLFRSVVEFLWVPVRSDVRRRTKAVVDTVAENAGDGVGALVVLLVVTLGGAPSRFLSPIVVLMSIAVLVYARRMGSEYFGTLRGRLAEGLQNETLAEFRPTRDIEPRTLSRLDVTRLLSSIDRADEGHDGFEGGGPDTGGQAADGGRSSDGARTPDGGRTPDEERAASDVALRTLMPRLDDEALRRRLAPGKELSADDAPDLALLLARDGVRALAARRLAGLGEAAGPSLARILTDETADFVVRRRVAQVLAFIPGVAARSALLAALSSRRFEVRYRAARALVQRRRGNEALSEDERETVWAAIRQELSRGRAVWELARLLDPAEHDELAGGRAAQRGELSLEHVFRMLSLVLEPEPIRAAWRGVTRDEEEFGSLALEYLEQVLPADVREKLWPFIGDLSAEQSRRAIRPLDAVIDELLETGGTLFRGDDRDRLQHILRPGTPEGGAGSPDEPDREGGGAAD